MTERQAHDHRFLQRHQSFRENVLECLAVLCGTFGFWILAVFVDPDGKNVKQTEFASGWIGTDGKYRGRPNDVLQAKDGSLLVADDFTGAIYRISYAK